MRPKAPRVMLCCVLLLAGPVAFGREEAGILVIVNGEPIPRSALAKILAPLEKAELPRQQVSELARKYTQDLVKDVLLRQFMRGQGYRPSEEAIEAEITRLRRIYEASRDPASPSFEEAIRRKGTSVRAMRAAPSSGMMFSCYVRGKITKRDVLRLFETERAGFDGTEFQARHILVDPRRMDGKSEPARRDMARQKAVELRTLALAAGADAEDEEFGELARRHSHCVSAAKGGDIGSFERFGAMPEKLAKAAFEAEPGQIPPVFETKHGFHVLKVTGRTPGRAVTLDEVWDKVAEAWAKREGLRIYEELHRKAEIVQPR